MKLTNENNETNFLHGVTNNFLLAYLIEQPMNISFRMS